MTNNKIYRRIRTAAMILCASVLVSCFPVSAADAGVQPTYDEAYYATTDWYGNLTQGSVVKSYALNGIAAVTDYGSYESLKNLTDGSAPDYKDGKAIFRFDTVPERLYFEGATAQPFAELPWTISIHYTLNGVAAEAKDLLDQKGVVEILIDAERNEAASEYAKNNYTLEIAALFHQDEILSLEADGAQVQLIGDLRTVLFMALPGETVHDVIRVGSENFSFGGLTILMIPATLGQINEIGKLSEDKEKLEENYRSISHALDRTMDTLDNASAQLRKTADGFDTLNEAREILHGGEDSVWEAADAALGDFTALRQSLAALPTHLDEADKLVNDSIDAVKNINTAVHALGEEYDEVDDALYSLKSELYTISQAGYATAYNLDRLGTLTDELGSGLSKILTSLGELQLGIGSGELTIQGMTAAQAAAKLTDAETLEELYSVAADGTLNSNGFVAKMLLLSGAATSDAVADASAAQLIALVQGVDSQVAAAMAADETLSHDAALTAVLTTLNTDLETYQKGKKLLTLYDALSGGAMSKKEFFLTVLPMTGMSEEDAEASWGLLQKSKSLEKKLDRLASVLGSGGISGDLADLLNALGDSVTDLRTIAKYEDKITESLDDVLDSCEKLTDLLEDNTDELKATVTDLKTATTAICTSLDSLTAFLQTTKSLFRSASEKLNDGSDKTLGGMASTFRSVADTLDTTDDIRAAKETVSSILEDAWHDYTGDVNTMLMMDADAEPVSLTDARNPAPQSVQILISTAAIDRDTVAEEQAKTEPVVYETPQPTFWDRVAQMFRDIWNAICGLFGKGSAQE